jgi:exodeoxyribonuclease X
VVDFLIVDTETLGMAPPSALIELGWHSVASHGGGYELGEWSGSELFGMQGQTMSPDNRAVHHISPAELDGRRDFSPEFLSHQFPAHSVPVDFAVAHNAEFESQWLDFGVPWLCTYKIALRLWPDAPSHSNGALKYLLGVEDRPEHHPPHRAHPDAVVTAELLVRILDETALRMPDATEEERLAHLVRVSSEHRLLPRCPIGKFRGRPWAEVESGFLSWMLRQTDMEADLKWCAERELTRRR